jgi:hypothetical protein
MVHDHYNDTFPFPQNGSPWYVPGIPDIPLPTQVEVRELRALIAEFKEAITAAKKLDIILKQPDCIDVEKAKLQERVDRLEKIIDALMVQK